ncbi:hypothetical protein SAMN05421890_1575 [Ensifer adhaerens]|nr:hypothetical protein SAMN05421890_1575 [Ensifer adhaerens]
MDRVNGADHVDIGGGRRGFKDEDLSIGADGTEVTADWLNSVQEEIMGVIEAAGLVADPTKWNQLVKVIRSQKLNYFDAAGSANALTVSLTPAPTSWAELVGVPIRLKIATPNTDAVTLSPNELAPKAIVSLGNNALKPGQLPGGAIVTAIYDGANVQVSAPLAPRFSTSLTIISAAGAGNYVVPAGVYRIGVYLWAGAPGGGGGSNTNNGYCGSCGAGSGYAYKEIDVTPGQIIPYFNGAGGIGGSPGNSGGTGQTTSFGSYFSATPGEPGIHGKFAIVGNVTTGGIGIGGDINVRGGNGAGCLPAAADGTGIGGGGGGSPFGAPPVPPSGGPGVDGSWPGGGGGGAGGTGGNNGGKGANGGIIIKVL